MATGSVTVKDVAREAAVSIGTVSRVFNNHANVAEDVRQRVLKTATELGYRGAAGNHASPALDGRDKRDRRNRRGPRDIGFLFRPVNDDTVASTNPFWSHILAGVEAEAITSNARLTYRSITELRHQPEAMLRAVQDMRLDGMLLVGPAELEVVRALQSTRLPLVLVEQYFPDQGLEAVIANYFDGARRATEYLIAQGHREIAIVNGPMDGGAPARNTLYPLELRAQGYRSALIEAALPVRHDLSEGSNLTPSGGYEACRRLLDRGAPFSALFCANDWVAIGAMKALREAGRDVPADVSLVGFGDFPDLADHLMPPLTTMHVDMRVLGGTAVKRLLARVADRGMPPVLNMLDVALVERQSVRRVT